MQRRILIIDDHDDLAGSLNAVFSAAGHIVRVVKDRDSALNIEDIDSYDLVITDLDVDPDQPSANLNGSNANCLPRNSSGEHVKAFKLCASNFRRSDFDENELTSFVETVLSYKEQFLDDTEAVRQLHEMVEFEIPSSILPMHSILDYLTERVEKLGVVDSKHSNLFVALDEAFVNAVKHGNKYDAEKSIRITAELSSREARFTVEDEGEGFDVNSIPDPLDPENLFKTSGRGCLFICNIMDEVQYNERGNRLTMIKRGQLDKV